MNQKRMLTSILSILLAALMCVSSFAQTTNVFVGELDENTAENEVVTHQSETQEEATEETVEETTEESVEETTEESVEEATEESVEETTEEPVEETTEETVEETTEETVEETTEETVEETTEETVEETTEETVEETEEVVEEAEEAEEEETADLSAETQPADNSKEAFVIVQNSQYAANKDYISSGWILDNRGGPARKSQGGSYDVLQDISTDAGTALMRPFTKVSDGEIVIETSIRVSGNGVSLILLDDEGNTLYEIKTVDSKWSILESDGNYTPVLSASPLSVNTTYLFRIYVNFDKGTAKTFINNTALGESELLSDNAAEFRFATDKESVVYAIPQSIHIYANYVFNETFTYYVPQSVYGWTVQKAPSIVAEELSCVSSTSLTKSFDKLTGKAIFETHFFLPAKENFTIDLCEGSKSLVKVVSQSGSLKVNSSTAYTLSKEMWYRLRIVVDAQNDTADVLLNGRSIKKLSLSAFSGVDYIQILAGSGNVKFDNMRMFSQPDFDDYVPTPEVSDDNYTVGINVCNIWRNGTHYGWGCISGYTEHEPVIGFYDEGVAETADWEIKYMVEHGIDFQATCWFPGTNSGPIKPGEYNHLHDGYMYAKYSDMMDYAVIWEASSSNFNSAQFRNYMVPYLIENYFSDKDRYLTIDGKAVMFVFNFTKLNCLGNDAAVKTELDYLESKVKALGYDGLILLTSSLQTYYSEATAAKDTGIAVNMGFDGSACYSRADGSCNSIEGNIKSNNDYGAQRDLAWIAAGKPTYTIPCANVGFDKMPWHKTRNPNITVQDFKTVLEWMRDDFAGLYGKVERPKWAQNFFMLSTWNEFGEGTYIFPSELNGFGYLDAVRDVFTNFESDHEDVVPQGEQRERVTHLYPQDLTYLRYQGYDEIGWHFDNDAEGWTSSLMNITHKNGVITVQNKSNKNEDPNIYIEGLNIMSDLYKGIRVRAGNIEWDSASDKTNNNIVIYYDSGSGYKKLGEKWYYTKTVDGFVEYYIPFSETFSNREIIQKLRFDPFNAYGKMDIDFIQLVPKDDMGFTPLSDDVLYINDNLVESRLSATTNGTDVFFAYDPELGMDFLLNSLVTWDRYAKTFKIESKNHTVEFTVGSADYYVDGVKKTLESVIDLRNGLPMLPAKQLAQGLGYGYRVKENKHYIYSDEYSTFIETLNNEKEGEWYFDNYNLGGWSSFYMRLITTENGTVILETNGTTLDPVMMVDNIDVDLSKYSAIEIGMKNYSFYDSVDGATKSNLSIFGYDTPTATATKLASKWLYSTSGSNEVWTLSLESDIKICKMRFDPFNALGTMELDYIKFIPIETPPVADAATSPTTLNVAQIREQAPQGMRYAAYIETAQEMCEYGFIVAREESLKVGGSVNYDRLKINESDPGYKGSMALSISGKNAHGVKYVGAVAIRGDISVIYSTNGNEFGSASLDDGLYFTTVLTGITPDKYTTKFTGRPYVKDANGNYYYGETITRSLYEVAKSIPAAERTDFVKSIISYVDDKDTFTDVGGLLG